MRQQQQLDRYDMHQVFDEFCIKFMLILWVCFLFLDRFQSKVRRDGRDRDRYERRVLDELSKMFNDSDSFYFSSEADLTSSLQRQSLSSYDRSLPIWRRANDNFFWNRHLLIDLISQEVGLEMKDNQQKCLSCNIFLCKKMVKSTYISNYIFMHTCRIKHILY